MIATCIANRSASLPDHQRGRLAELDSEYPLTPGSSYIVVGMGIWENVLHFLLRDDTGWPTFVPVALFDCPAQDVPNRWLFSLQAGARAHGRDLWVTPCAALWGYETLVLDPDHASLLGERDDEAVSEFFRELVRREGEIDGSDAIAE